MLVAASGWSQTHTPAHPDGKGQAQHPCPAKMGPHLQAHTGPVVCAAMVTVPAIVLLPVANSTLFISGGGGAVTSRFHLKQTGLHGSRRGVVSGPGWREMGTEGWAQGGHRGPLPSSDGNVLERGQRRP